MQEYTIYFEQVNQTRFKITARNPENALKRAIREWKQENVYPIYYIEDENGDEVR